MARDGHRLHSRKPSRRPAATVVEPSPSVGNAVSIFHTHRACLAACLATLLLKSLIFAPLGVWPATFVCLVPWLWMVGSAPSASRVYAWSFVLGLVFFLVNMHWLYFATGWGYVALAVYLAAFFPLMACPLRSVVRRRGWRLAWTFPVVWTGGELVRAVALSGFPWFFLSHSFYQVLPLIQVSDLVGAYGVSFVAAAVNGCCVDVLASRWRCGRAVLESAKGMRSWPSVAVAAGLLALTLGYGVFQLQRETTSSGPKVAVLQGDFVSAVYGDDVPEPEKQQLYLSMLDDAAGQRPDVFLIPETPWIMYLNKEARDFFALSRQSFAALQDRARKYAAHVVAGCASMIPTPHDLLTRDRRYNSAMVFTPDGAEPQRYDKVHLVYFGEIVPFRFGRFRFLYFWLNSLMPFSGADGSFEYSLFPGERFTRFTLKASSVPGRNFRFGVPICYEDVMPYVARRFAAGNGDGQKGVDFLLNISNDGWFGRGVQQPQHLAICVFRAVENRVGIARAVNTGISGFVDPDGRLHDLVPGTPEDGWPGAAGYRVGTLRVDSRWTLYSRFGDWFGWACAIGALALFGDYWVARVRARRVGGVK